MIIGLNATSSHVQMARVLGNDSACFEWDASHCIEGLPHRLHQLMLGQPKPRGGLVILGPGSYTALRVSLTAMKMLHMVHQFPLLGLSLFDAYLGPISSTINGLVLLTSPSRKGHVNAQLHQSKLGKHYPITSLLQLSHQRLVDVLNQFQSPIQWHWFGDSPIDPPQPIIAHAACLNLLATITHYAGQIHGLSNQGRPLKPIYSYPPVARPHSVVS